MVQNIVADDELEQVRRTCRCHHRVGQQRPMTDAVVTITRAIQRLRIAGLVDQFNSRVGVTTTATVASERGTGGCVGFDTERQSTIHRRGTTAPIQCRTSQHDQDQAQMQKTFDQVAKIRCGETGDSERGAMRPLDWRPLTGRGRAPVLYKNSPSKPLHNEPQRNDRRRLSCPLLKPFPARSTSKFMTDHSGNGGSVNSASVSSCVSSTNEPMIGVLSIPSSLWLTVEANSSDSTCDDNDG